MVKPPLRTKSIGFKVSEEEYAQLETAAQADGRTLGEWCREAILRGGSASDAARHDPALAGLAAVDPSNPQTWNRYAYVMNNPVSYIDPTGLKCLNRQGRVSCTGDAGGFGDSSNEFDLMNIPFYGPSQLTATNLPATVVGTMFDYGELSDTFDTGDIRYTPNQTLYTLSPGDQIGTGFDLFGGSPANNGSWLQNAWNYIKSHPITISVSEILAGQITYQHSTKTICGSVGAGASVPPTNLVTAGILNEGNMQNWQGVVSGPSYSFSANLFVGYQGSFSSSGKVGGPSITPGIGVSGSYTIGGCGPAPW